MLHWSFRGHEPQIIATGDLHTCFYKSPKWPLICSSYHRLWEATITCSKPSLPLVDSMTSAVYPTIVCTAHELHIIERHQRSPRGTSLFWWVVYLRLRPTLTMTGEFGRTAESCAAIYSNWLSLQVQISFKHSFSGFVSPSRCYMSFISDLAVYWKSMMTYRAKSRNGLQEVGPSVK